MTISIMDLFYMFMIAVICGFVIHLEAQVTMILKMLEERYRFEDKLCEQQKKTDFENRLDKISKE